MRGRGPQPEAAGCVSAPSPLARESRPTPIARASAAGFATSGVPSGGARNLDRERSHPCRTRAVRLDVVLAQMPIIELAGLHHDDDVARSPSALAKSIGYLFAGYQPCLAVVLAALEIEKQELQPVLPAVQNH